MRKPRLRSQSGVTIIEVLVASVVFMVGFTTLVALINGTLLKFSTKELTTGGAAAQEVILRSIASADTTSLDTTLNFSGIRYRVVKQVTRTDNLLKIVVTVFRAKTKKQVIQLYDAFAPPQK